MGPDSVVFDMDGTLLDLPVAIEDVRRRLDRLFGPMGYADGFRPILPCIERAARCVGTSPREVRHYRNQARHILTQAEVMGAQNATARPGAVALVASLVQHDVPLGLVTDNGRACIKLALEQAGFAPQWWPEDRIVSRDDVSKPKPNPEGVIRLAEKLANAGRTVWYVGDSVRDIAAGQAANAELPNKRVATIAVDGGRSSASELAKQSPTNHIPDISGVHGIIHIPIRPCR